MSVSKSLACVVTFDFITLHKQKLKIVIDKNIPDLGCYLTFYVAK